MPVMAVEQLNTAHQNEAHNSLAASMPLLSSYLRSTNPITTSLKVNTNANVDTIHETDSERKKHSFCFF